MPVFYNPLNGHGGRRIGHVIRDQRQKQGLTLKQLADRLKMSQAKLSNIETGKVGLDLGELAAIGTAIEVPIGTFFTRTRAYHYLVRRSEEIAREPPLTRRLVGPTPGPAVDHNRIWPLAQQFVGKHMDPVLSRIEPLRADDLHFISHDHEEFMFVLRGEVETSLRTHEGTAVEHLTAGDCIYYRAYLPHCHRSPTDTPAETLNVMYSLRGAIDPADDGCGPSSHRFYRRGAESNFIREASEKIALLRRAHGFTLPELAKYIGTGVRYLGQVERGERPPDVELLLSLARRFRRPVEYFLATSLDAQPSYFVQRGADIHSLPTSVRRSSEAGATHVPHVFRPLAVGFPDRGLHPYYLQVRRYGPDQEPSPGAHYGQEFIYVLDGEVEFVTQLEDGIEHREVLHPGDSLFLESSAPHLLRGHSRNPYASSTAEVIDVFWSPLGETYLFSPSADAATARQATPALPTPVMVP
jgi:transcriptional regulator with XRE-family HTH domain/quercetin dioxygenase-like cupin family protein